MKKSRTISSVNIGHITDCSHIFQSNYVYRNDHRKNLSHDIRAVILLPGSELIACQEKENTLISFTRPDLERKMHRDLACLRFYENKIASFQQKKSVDLKAAKTLLL